MQEPNDNCEEQGCTNVATRMFKWNYAYSLLCNEHFEIAEEHRLKTIDDQSRKAYHATTRNSIAAWQRSRV